MAFTMKSGGNLATSGDLGILSTDAVLQIDKNVYYHQPDDSPFVLLLTAMGAASIAGPTIKHMEQSEEPRVMTINGAVVAGTGSASANWVVDDASTLFVNQILYAQESDASVQITAIATNSLTVRPWPVTGNTPAVADNEEISVGAGAFPENSTKLTEGGPIKEEVTHYTQIYRGQPFGVSRTLSQTQLYSGVEMDHQELHYAMAFKKNLEFNAFFGVKAIINSGTSYPTRTATGAQNFITSAASLSNAPTMTNIGAALIDTAQEGSATKFGFVSYLGHEKINAQYYPEANNVVEVEIGSKDVTAGIRVSKSMSAASTILWMPHRLLGKQNTLGKTAFLIDPSKVRKRTLQPMVLLTGIEANGQDGKSAEFLEESGMQWYHPGAHKRLTNLYA